MTLSRIEPLQETVQRNDIRDSKDGALDKVAWALLWTRRESGESDETLRARLIRELGL